LQDRDPFVAAARERRLLGEAEGVTEERQCRLVVRDLDDDAELAHGHARTIRDRPVGRR
jgi:hypothetical protein